MNWIPRLSSHEKRLLWLLGSTSFFSQYDLGLFSLLLVQIQDDFAIPESQLGLLGSTVRLGSVFAFFALILADRRGRRSVLLWTIVGFAGTTAATAFAPDYLTFTALQTIGRMFMSAELLLAGVFIIEELEPRHRGWAIGMLGMLAVLGRGAGLLLFGFVESIPFGWRGLYAVGVLPLLWIAWLRRALPETQRFENLHTDLPLASGWREVWQPLRSLARSYPGRFAAVAAVAFLWSFSNGPTDFFLPKLVQEAHGWVPADYATLALTAGAVGLLGFPIAGRLSDRYGRRPIAIVFTILEPVMAIALYGAFGALIVPMFALWVFSSFANDVVLSAYRAELFPTSSRSTAVGAIALVAAAGSVLGLALEAVLYGVWGSHWVPVQLIAATGVGMVVIVFLAYPETSGRALEDVSPERN